MVCTHVQVSYIRRSRSLATTCSGIPLCSPAISLLLLPQVTLIPTWLVVCALAVTLVVYSIVLPLWQRKHQWLTPEGQTSKAKFPWFVVTASVALFLFTLFLVRHCRSVCVCVWVGGWVWVCVCRRMISILHGRHKVKTPFFGCKSIVQWLDFHGITAVDIEVPLYVHLCTFCRS